MPDESKRIQRELTKGTGASTSEITKALTGMLVNFGADVEARAAAPRQTETSRPAAMPQTRKIETNTTSFQPSQFISPIPRPKPSEAAQVATGGTGGDIPAGTNGDILYFNGTTLTILSNPGASSSPPNTNWVLRHDGSAPYWEEASSSC
jgi:hypothetical protein